MERFGYPDFVLASDELIARQYADRPELRRVYDAVVRAAARCGDVIIQARKTYVSLVSPRRTFARIQPTTKTRVDPGLRLEGRRPAGRLKRSTVHDTMPVQVGLTAPADVTWDRRSTPSSSARPSARGRRAGMENTSMAAAEPCRRPFMAARAAQCRRRGPPTPTEKDIKPQVYLSDAGGQRRSRAPA